MFKKYSFIFIEQINFCWLVPYAMNTLSLLIWRFYRCGSKPAGLLNPLRLKEGSSTTSKTITTFGAQAPLEDRGLKLSKKTEKGGLQKGYRRGGEGQTTTFSYNLI